MLSKIGYKNICASFLLLLLASIFLYKQIFLGFIPTPQDSGQGDITHYAYPLLDFYSRQLHNGVFPLWSDEISNGHPIAAEGQIGPFFPPNLFLYSLLDTPTAFTFSYLLAFAVSSLGMYWYMRFLKAGVTASLISSIVYSFSFVFVTHMLTINVLQSIAFFPLVLLFSERLFLNNARYNFLALAIIICLQFLAGFPQTSFYSIVGVLVILFLKYRLAPGFLNGIVRLLFAALVGLLLSSVQIFPMVELFLNSTRTGLGSQGTNSPFTLLDLGYLFYPFIWGDPSLASYKRLDGLFWESNMYVGFVPLLLVTTGIAVTRIRSSMQPYLFSALLWILFSLGVFFFLSYIPPFSFFRLPQRSLFLFVFSISVISGLVLDKLSKKYVHNKYASFIFAGVIVFCFMNLFLLGKDYNGGLKKETFLKEPATSAFLKTGSTESKVFSLGNAYDWNMIYHKKSYGWQSDRAEIMLQNRSLMHPNSNVLYGIPAFYGYTVFRLKDANDLNAVTFSGSRLDTPPYFISSSSAKILGSFGVSHIIAPDKVTSGSKMSLEKEIHNGFTNGTYYIYKNPFTQPSVRNVKRLVVFPTIQDQVRYLLGVEFEPASEVTSVGFPSVQEFDSSAPFSLYRPNPHEYIFKMQAQNAAFFTVAHSFYPGWKLTVDGIESSLLKVNINALGFIVPKGNHTVRMYYDPLSVKLGLFVSLATITFAFFSICYPFARKVVH